MKLLFIGDLHLADRKKAHEYTLGKREHIVNHDFFDSKLIAHLNQSTADHLFFLGDLVDWYCPENADKALAFLNQLNKPWSLTPGNHDYQLDLLLRPDRNDGKVHEWADETPLIGKQRAVEGWQVRGVETKSRKVCIGDVSVYLMDSAVGAIPEEDQRWFLQDIKEDSSAHKIFASHVPLPFVDRDKKFKEYNKDIPAYLQQGLIDGFEECLLKNIDRAYCGHVHFAEIYKKEKTEFHMVSISNAGDLGDTFEGISAFETD